MLTALLRIPSSRHSTASFTNLETSRNCRSAMSWLKIKKKVNDKHTFFCKDEQSRDMNKLLHNNVP